MDRRNFLKMSLFAAGSLGVQTYSLPLLASGNRRKVVVVFLRGGADVVSLFPPKLTAAQRQNYEQHPLKQFRGTSSTAAQNFLFGTRVGSRNTTSALQIGNHSVDFHPSFAVMQSIIASQNFALLLHTGSLNNTRSHFEQMDLIESGSVNRKLRTGYLGRAHQLIANRGQALAIGAAPPRALLGTDVALANSLADLRGVYHGTRVNGRTLSRTERLDLFKNYADASCPQNSLCEIVLNAQSNYTTLERDMAGFSNTAQNGFEQHCEIAAQLTNGTANPPLITVDHLGWDHHFNQDPTDTNGIFGKKVAELANGLKTLYDRAHPDTVIIVMSEFGRTLVANANMGTDHGRGSAMMILGRSIQRNRLQHIARTWDFSPASLQGTGPSQALQVKHDAREILAEVLNRHLGVSLSAVNPEGHTVFDGLTSLTRLRRIIS